MGASWAVLSPVATLRRALASVQGIQGVDFFHEDEFRGSCSTNSFHVGRFTLVCLT